MIDNVKKYFFKVLKDLRNDEVVIIYSCVQTRIVQPEEDKSTILCMVLNITKSIVQNNPYIDTYECTDEETFLKDFMEYDGPIGDVLSVYTMLFSELQAIALETDSLTRCFKTIKGIVENKEDEDDTRTGLSAYVDGDSSLLDGVLKSINGRSKISKKEVSNVINAVTNEVMNNLDVDLDDEESVNELKSRLEWKLIEALPNTHSLESVSLNTEKIIELIKRLKAD